MVRSLCPSKGSGARWNNRARAPSGNWSKCRTSPPGLLGRLFWAGWSGRGRPGNSAIPCGVGVTNVQRGRQRRWIGFGWDGPVGRRSGDTARLDSTGRAADQDRTTGSDRSMAKGTAMSVSLTKGGNVSLTKAAPGLKAVSVGLGWDARSTTGADFDLDASALGLGDSHRIVSDEYFVFFNNMSSPEGAIVHQGDNLTGEGEGDDEVINVDLTAVPATVGSIVFPVSIYEGDARGQSFGQVV